MTTDPQVLAVAKAIVALASGGTSETINGTGFLPKDNEEIKDETVRKERLQVYLNTNNPWGDAAYIQDAPGGKLHEVLGTERSTNPQYKDHVRCPGADDKGEVRFVGNIEHLRIGYGSYKDEEYNKPYFDLEAERFEISLSMGKGISATSRGIIHCLDAARVQPGSRVAIHMKHWERGDSRGLFADVYVDGERVIGTCDESEVPKKLDRLLQRLKQWEDLDKYRQTGLTFDHRQNEGIPLGYTRTAIADGPKVDSARPEKAPPKPRSAAEFEPPTEVTE